MTIVFPHKPALPSILPILVTNVTSCSGAQARSWQAGSSQFGEDPPPPLRLLIPTESLGFEYSRLLPGLLQQLPTGLPSGPTPVLLTKYKQEHITRRLLENLPCSPRLLDKPPPAHGLQGPACASLPSLPPKSTCRPLCISGNAPRRHLPRFIPGEGLPSSSPRLPAFPLEPYSESPPPRQTARRLPPARLPSEPLGPEAGRRPRHSRDLRAPRSPGSPVSAPVAP